MEVRLATEDDITACNAFHNTVYQRSRTIEQWRWEFASPLLPNNIVPYALAEDNGRVVGTQALIPVRMVAHEGVYWTAKSEETLVAQDYRGRQLFEQMYELLFNYGREHGIRSIWGFTPATKAFIRMGFDIPAKTQQLLFPFSREAGATLSDTKVSPVGGRLGKWVVSTAVAAGARYSSFRASVVTPTVRAQTAAQNISLRTLDEPPEGAADLCHFFVSKWGGTTIYRDGPYLRWRLFSNPHVRPFVRAAYEGDTLLGWIASSVGDEGIGYIVDLFVACRPDASCDDEHVIRLLLCDAVENLRSAGATGIRGWRVNNHPFDRLVTRVAKGVGFFHFHRGHSVVVYNMTDPGQSRTPGWFDDWYVNRIYTEGLAG
jgi:N-acetylglutamate synthase-like GNAT family acetyltransferase